MKKIFLYSALGILSFVYLASSAYSQTYHVGDRIEVRWNGFWYEGSIIEKKADGGLFKIHYCGRDSDLDEWISTSRMRIGHYKVGDTVQGLWKGEYYPAKILKAENGRFFVHYLGFESKWDEWVTCERIRKAN